MSLGHIIASAADDPSVLQSVFTIMEKKALLRHYVKQALTPQ